MFLGKSGGDFLTKYEYLDRESYIKEYGEITRKCIQNDPDLTPMERELSIVITDTEEMAMVASSQKPVMKYLLLDNENFEIIDKGLVVKNGRIVGINGEISKNCIRFSKKPRKRFGRLA